MRLVGPNYSGKVVRQIRDHMDIMLICLKESRMLIIDVLPVDIGSNVWWNCSSW